MGADRSWGLDDGGTDPWSTEVAAPAAPWTPAAPPTGPHGGPATGPSDAALPPGRPWRFVGIVVTLALVLAFGVVVFGGSPDTGAPPAPDDAAEPSPPVAGVSETPTVTADAAVDAAVDGASDAATGSDPATGAERSAEIDAAEAVGEREAAEAQDPAVDTALVGEVPPAVASWPEGSGPAVVVAVLAGDELSTIDLASGLVTSVREVDVPSSGAPVYLVSARGAFTAISWDRVDGFRLNADGTYAVIGADDQPGGPLLAGPLPGTLWEWSIGERGFVRLVDVTGRPQGPLSVLQDAELVGSGGDGRLLLAGPGGVYRIAVSEDNERVTTGVLAAIGSTVAYARECDEAFRCDAVRVDLESGERTPVTVRELATASTELVAGVPDGYTVSPDGDVAFVRRSGFGLGWVFVDTATGAVVEAPGPREWSPIVWTDDSAFAVYLSGDRLRVFDRAAGRVVEVFDDDVRAFTLVDPAEAT